MRGALDYADLRILSGAGARVTGVPGRPAARSCKKVLQGEK